MINDPQQLNHAENGPSVQYHPLNLSHPHSSFANLLPSHQFFPFPGTMFNILELNATVDELKPVNEAITKDFEEKRPTEASPPSSSESHVNSKKDLSLTKEVEVPPVINDPSPKLNRTFRKMVPLMEKQNVSAAGNLDTTTEFLISTIVNNVTEDAFEAVTEEPKKPNRKRILTSEKKNGYPYYLGRVIG